MRAPIPGYLEPRHDYPEGVAVPGYQHAEISNKCLRFGAQHPPNIHDECLLSEWRDWEHISACGGLVNLACPIGRRPYDERPWITQPELGRRFNPIGSLSVSSGSIVIDGATANRILRFVVPYGYNGVINYFVNEIAGASPTGFIEGSGSVTWRLSASRRYLRDMGAILFSQGSLLTPSPIPNGGLRIYSGNVVDFEAVLATPTPLAPSAVIVCALSGWIYPM